MISSFKEIPFLFYTILVITIVPRWLIYKSRTFIFGFKRGVSWSRGSSGLPIDDLGELLKYTKLTIVVGLIEWGISLGIEWSTD